jgi:hypothetical protein
MGWKPHRLGRVLQGFGAQRMEEVAIAGAQQVINVKKCYNQNLNCLYFF